MVLLGGRDIVSEPAVLDITGVSSNPQLPPPHPPPPLFQLKQHHNGFE